MLRSLFLGLHEWGGETFSALNLFRYITFRTGGALFTSFALSFYTGPHMIRWLKSKQKEGQPIRLDGPTSHLETKKGTPTMGGLLILMASLSGVLLWTDLHNTYVWLVVITLVIFGGMGFYDDFLKLTRRNTHGLRGWYKLLIQACVALGVVMVVMQHQGFEAMSALSIPFTKNALIHLGWFYFPFALTVIAGASNAVNLTDGLDGLAIVPVMIVAACFCIISYVVGHLHFAHYSGVPHVVGAGELAVICGSLMGAGLGFLWYNAPPAMVFMGDTGSLSMGGALGVISLITKHEIVLALAGGLFVIETVSVILQVFSYKTRRKRIFLMAPIHHHFEKKGWKEPTIVIRFWIIAILFGLLSLSTLKIR